MVSLNKIKSVAKSVEKLLTKNEKLRDNDDQLIATIWYNEIKSNPDLSAKEFLVILGKGKLTSPEAIRRARQKLQEKNSDLRGTNYKGRDAEKENIRQGIHEV